MRNLILIGWLLSGIGGFSAYGQVLPHEAFSFTALQPQGSLKAQRPALLYVVVDSTGRVWGTNGMTLMQLWNGAIQPARTTGDTLPPQIDLLLTDARGHAWIVARGELFNLDPLTHRLTRHPLSAGDSVLRLQHRRIAPCRDGLLLATGRSDLWHYNTQSAVLKQPAFAKMDRSKPVRLYESTDRFSWLLNGEQLYRIDMDKGCEPEWIGSIPANTDIWQVHAIGSWIYLASTNGEVFEWQPGQSGWRRYHWGVNVTRKLGTWYVNGEALLTISGPQGMYVHRPGGYTEHWQYSLRPHTLTTDGWVFGFFGHPTQGHWISTVNGNYYLPAGQWPGQPYWLFGNEWRNWPAGTLQEPGWLTRLPGRHQLMFVRRNRLYLFDTRQRRLAAEILLHADTALQIQSLLAVTGDDVLLGSSRGLLHAELAMGRVQNIAGPEAGEKIISLAIDGDNILASSRQRSYRIGIQKPFRAVADGEVQNRRMTNDASGALYQRQGKQILKRQADGSWAGIIPDSLVAAFYAPANGYALSPLDNSLFLYTNEGLYHIGKDHPASASFYSLDQLGLTAQISGVWAISRDKLAIVAAKHPLCILDTRTGQVRHKGIGDGWWGENMGANLQLERAEDGHWWCLFDGGLIDYGPEWFEQEPLRHAAPQLMRVMTGSAQQPIAGASEVYRLRTLTIPWRQMPLSFEWTGVDSDSIYTRLLPYDTTWTPSSLIRYASLPGGTYRLQARQMLGPGREAEIAEYQVRVIPPLWQRPWFKWAAALLIAGIAYALVRRQLYQQQKRHAVELRLAQSELTAIRSQMNPHFIFNCMSAIDGLIATGQGKEASAYLAKFSRLMRLVLQQSSKQLIPLQDELDLLKLYLQLEQLRMRHGFEYRIQVDPAVPDDLEVPPLLLQPFAENAILHGLQPKTSGSKQIGITVTAINEVIEVSIADNGIGRQAAADIERRHNGHQSLGGRLSGERLQLMETVSAYRASVHYEDRLDAEGNPAGTTVHIRLEPK